MKAFKTRYLIDLLVGIIQSTENSANDIFALKSRILESNKELVELERLAELGKAVETAVLEGSPWIIDTYSGIYTCPNEEDIKTLISWYRGESGEE